MDLPAAAGSRHKLESLQCKPPSQLGFPAIMSCHLVSILSCSQRRGAEVHLRGRDTELWVQLSKYTTFTCDQKQEGKVQPVQLCCSQTPAPHISTHTTYLLPFHRVSTSFCSPSRPSPALRVDVFMTRVLTAEWVCVSHCSTFLTERSGPAVQAAAAAAATLARRPVLALAGLRAVGPETILSAVWHQTAKGNKISLIKLRSGDCTVKVEGQPPTRCTQSKDFFPLFGLVWLYMI